MSTTPINTESEKILTEQSSTNGGDVTVEEPNIGRKYATADEILTNAPKDLVERDVENVFGGLTVKVRSLTAAESAHVKQQSFSMDQRSGMQMMVPQMERIQFQIGVIEPKFTHEQVLILHRTSGPSFNRVIEVIDEISGVNKETLREARREFQEP